jgi:uncharacterized membrane protein
VKEMFVIVFRELIVIAAGLVIVWFIWSQVRKIRRRDARKEHAKEMIDNINEIIELSKSIPSVDTDKLIAAKQKLEKLHNQGS